MKQITKIICNFLCPKAVTFTKRNKNSCLIFTRAKFF